MRNSLKKDYIFQQKDYICIPKNEVFVCFFKGTTQKEALVAELVDALDSKSSDCKIVWVRFPPKVQQTKKLVNRERAPKRKLAFFLE